MLLEDLNPVQLDAVKTTEGPLLIVAGAGTGKTRVLTHRIAYLIRECGVAPREVLAITFTNKAANEMKERVAKLLGKDVGDMWVRTFHSACVRILRHEAHHLGYSPSFSVYDATDSRRAIGDIIRDLNMGESPKEVQAAISKAKNQLVDSEDYATWMGGSFRAKRVAEIYREYQKMLRRSSAFDFDDLLMVTVNLFSSFPEVLAKYQKQFRYIHVDEYQDTNHAQYELVGYLAARHKNVCVVGDPDQAIYGFRGADIRNIRSFEKDYPQAKVVVLEQNYRSTENILDAANAVIAQNQHRQSKNLWTNQDSGLPIFSYHGRNDSDEANFVVKEILNLKEAHGMTGGDIAVLYRVRKLPQAVERVLDMRGLPYQLIGGTAFYERAEIKDVLAYLRLIDNPDDTVALRRVLNGGIGKKRGIGEKSQYRVEEWASNMGIHLMKALEQVDDIPGLTPKSTRGVYDFLVALNLLMGRVSEGPATLVEVVLDEIDYQASFEEGDSNKARGRLENLEELRTRAHEFERQAREQVFDGQPWEEMTGQQRLQAYLDSVALVSDIDELNEDTDAETKERKKITLMTLHSAKGLEFPVVFMMGMEEGFLPHARSLDEPEEVEEERRLCYVGITRAQKRIYLSSARTRFLYGASHSNKASRFLDEVPDYLVEGT